MPGITGDVERTPWRRALAEGGSLVLGGRPRGRGVGVMSRPGGGVVMGAVWMRAMGGQRGRWRGRFRLRRGLLGRRFKSSSSFDELAGCGDFEFARGGGRPAGLHHPVR